MKSTNLICLVSFSMLNEMPKVKKKVLFEFFEMIACIKSKGKLIKRTRYLRICL